ncbi:MAG: hypothetical protein HHJ18_12145 [Polaromonas sp.]|nr:hypothetical protein [Polaromonas sp.]
MKSFLIKAPGKGKTTCALVRQFYDKETRKTKTEYLGSVNVATDPAQLPVGIKTRPGVGLDVPMLAEIRDWLERNGTFGKKPELPLEVLMAARRQVLAEIADAGLPDQQSDLEAAASVLGRAALEVQAKAAQMRAAGIELSKGFLGFTGVATAKCANEMDLLKIHTNRIRSACSAFEDALKAARLMKRVNKPGKGSTSAPA